MKDVKGLLSGYENTELVLHTDIDKLPNTVAYDDLENLEVTGVLKANRYVNGKLIQTYSTQESHVGVIAATRLGKTTQYVIPTILSFAKQKRKRSMVISDPKGELYRITSETLRKEGYRVRLINFRDFMHSECWNPLTEIYRRYQAAFKIEDTVELVDTPNGPRNRFMGVIYENQTELDKALETAKKIAVEGVANDINEFASVMISVERSTDPYWEESARDLLIACIWAMLEDSRGKVGKRPKITESTFSISTLLSIMDSMVDSDGSTYNDGGYFSSRDKNSRAYLFAKNCILENGHVTRKCVVSTFNAKISIYKSSAIRLITSCNSFEMEELTDEKHPIAVFIDYRDEAKASYKVISSLIQSAYGYLIEYANRKPNGKLDVPFYFILDEFGNFPAIKDFETVISACGGRNVFFILILQSYAQLNNVYGKDVATIIRDNLNQHVFIGSNNPETLREFSAECGDFTRISPVSALNGTNEEIEAFSVETIPLMPKSRLAKLQEGECIVTEANCGYVMLSRLERYYLCPEMNDLPRADANDYFGKENPMDEKFTYAYSARKGTSGDDFF